MRETGAVVIRPQSTMASFKSSVTPGNSANAYGGDDGLYRYNHRHHLLGGDSNAIMRTPQTEVN